MGELLAFGRNRKSASDWNDLFDRDAHASRVIGSVERVCGVGVEEQLKGVTVAMLHPMSREINVHPVSADYGRATIALPLSLPERLSDNGDLDPDQALEIAVDYAAAYGLLVRGRKMRKSPIPTFVNSQREDCWEAQPSTIATPQISVPYRFAGTIALNAQDGSESLEFGNPPAILTPTLAGLANPLTVQEARTLHSFMSA